MVNRAIKTIILIIIFSQFITGCDFISNTAEYRDKSKEFVEKVLDENYDACIDLMALEQDSLGVTNLDSMKMGMVNFRNLIVENFGEELDYTFMKSIKKFSTNPDENMAPNTTKVHIQFDNEEEFGVLEVLFDDITKKIINIRPLNVKQVVPDLTFFWLFCLLALCVLAFNIYMIIQVKRSQLTHKWIKYIAIIFLNIPTIGYKAAGSVLFWDLSIQAMFGVSFSMMGYLGTVVKLGIPLGGLYWLWRLRVRKNKSLWEEPEHIEKEELS